MYIACYKSQYHMSLSVCVSPLLIRTRLIRFRAHPNPLPPHLNELHLQRPCFQIGHVLRFQVDRNLGGHNSAQYGICCRLASFPFSLQIVGVVMILLGFLRPK